VANLHEKEISDLYSSLNIIRLIKSRIMGGAYSPYAGEER